MGSPRPGRRRALAALIAIGAAALAGLVPVGAASAAPAAPRIVVVAGTRSATVAWAQVAGATTTTVRISRHRSLAHPRLVTVRTGRVQRIARLVDGATYWARVEVHRTRGRSTLRSAVVRVRPTTGAPTAAAGVTAVPGSAIGTVRVTWHRSANATAVRVIAGANSLETQHAFSSAWLPATAWTVQLRVPVAEAALLGPGTGNPVHVRVEAVNGDDPATAPLTRSATGVWSVVRSPAPVADSTRLRIAEWNVQSVGATSTFTPAHQWAARAPKVAAMIQSVHPDLLMTAELSTSIVDGCKNTKAQPLRCAPSSQVGDLTARLPGLRLADDDPSQRVFERRTAHPEWAPALTSGAHLYYDPAKLQLLDHGFLAPATPPDQSFADVTGLGVSGWTGALPIGADRWLSWGEFATTDAAHRRFVAVAAHYPVGPQPAVVAARQEETAKALAAIDRIAGGLPVVFGGDVNDDPVRNDPAVQPTFVRAGWFDASATNGVRTNVRLGTSAVTVPDDGDPGYGTKPLVYTVPAGRIDFLLTKGAPSSFRYDNLQPRLANGLVDPALQGSDHTMQLAEIGIGGPAR